MAKRKKPKGGSEAAAVTPKPKPRPVLSTGKNRPIVRRREDVVQAARRVVKTATENV